MLKKASLTSERVLSDKVRDVSDVHAQLDVSVGEVFDGEGVVDIGATLGVDAHHGVAPPKVTPPLHLAVLGGPLNLRTRFGHLCQNSLQN